MMINEYVTPPARETHTPPVPSPRWLRRLDASPGVIDAAAAQRVYARTAGWALQRIARTGNMVARYASAAGGAVQGDLLLVRPLALAAAAAGEPNSSEGIWTTGVAYAEGERSSPSAGSSEGVDHALPAALSAAAPSTLALRLQRRIAKTGVVSARMLPPLTHVDATLSLRPGLQTRLAARGNAVPQPTIGTVLLAHHSDEPMHGKESGRFDASAARVAKTGDATPAAACVAPATASAAGASGASSIARTAVEATAPRRAVPESLAEIPVATVDRHAMEASTYEKPTSLAAVAEAVPAASVSRSADRALPLAGASLGTTSDAASMPHVTAVSAGSGSQSSKMQDDGAAPTLPQVPKDAEYGASAARGAEAGDVTPAAALVAPPTAVPEPPAETPAAAVDPHTLDASADGRPTSLAAVAEAVPAASVSRAADGALPLAGASLGTTSDAASMPHATVALGGGSQASKMPSDGAAPTATPDPADAEYDASAARGIEAGDVTPAAALVAPATAPAVGAAGASALARTPADVTAPPTAVPESPAETPAATVDPHALDASADGRPTSLAAVAEAVPAASVSRAADGVLPLAGASLGTTSDAASMPHVTVATGGGSQASKMPSDGAAPTATQDPHGSVDQPTTIARGSDTASINRPVLPRQGEFLPRTTEIPHLTSDAGGEQTTLHLARAIQSDAQPGKESNTEGFDAARASAVGPSTAVGVSAPPPAAGLVQRAAGPLTFARMPGVRAARADETSAVHPLQPTVRERVIARTAEISAAATLTPETFVWRTMAQGPARARPRPSRGAGRDAGLMRSAVDTATDSESSPALAPDAAMPGAGGTELLVPSSSAATPTAPDLNLLAEQVTRMIVRRLEVEHERRGGKTWL